MDTNGVSSETLELIKKASTGVTSSLGLTGIDLIDYINLVPVPSTFYDKLAKTSPDVAGPYAIWRVLTNINNQQSNPSTAFDYAAPLHKNNLLTVSSAYAKIGYGYTVTKDAIALAKGFADAKALEVFSTLMQYKIGADKMALGGQNFALNTPGTPVVTTATTGGSIAATTAVNVKVAARTGENYYYGGSTVASAQGTVTTGAGSTNSATATVAAVRGAVAYDWYVAGFYYTTTVVNKVTITSIPTANAGSVPNLPGLFATPPSAVPVADSSADANAFNGLLATLAGDYISGAGQNGLVSAGSGVASGATFQSLDGAGFTGSGQNINELDALNAAVFANTYLSPSAYMCSSVDAAAISKLLLAGAGATTFFTPGADGRSDVTAGGFIGHYINKAAGGVPVRIEVHPNMVPGTLIARTDQITFPNSGISNVFEIRSLDEVADYEYGVSRILNQAGGGPRFDGEVYSTSTLINRAPVAQAVLQNILS